jgi:cystathionine beta-synthase
MRENRYLEPAVRLTAGECLRHKVGGIVLQSASPADTAQNALQKMDELNISQLPVRDGEEFVGSVTEDRLVALVLQGEDLTARIVREVMGSPFPIVEPHDTIDRISGLLRGETAVLVRMADGSSEILTKSDVVHAIAGLAETER